MGKLRKKGTRRSDEWGANLPEKRPIQDRALDMSSPLIALIPWVGNAFARYIDGIGLEKKFGRIYGALDDLKEEFEKAKTEAAEKYVTTEEFGEFCEKTFVAIAHEANEEKRKLYGDILLGLVKDPPSYEIQARMLRAMNNLEAAHIHVLKAVIAPPTPGKSGVAPSHILDVVLERTGPMSEEYLRELWGDLQANHILKQETNDDLSMIYREDKAEMLEGFLTSFGRIFVDSLKRRLNRP